MANERPDELRTIELLSRARYYQNEKVYSSAITYYGLAAKAAMAVARDAIEQMDLLAAEDRTSVALPPEVAGE
jgi:hypothetical protein